jgi:hypothetical protein
MPSPVIIENEALYLIIQFTFMINSHNISIAHQAAPAKFQILAAPTRFQMLIGQILELFKYAKESSSHFKCA